MLNTLLKSQFFDDTLYGYADIGKAIILDLDGTVLHSDKSISDYTLSILEQCKKKGIFITVATARSETAAKRYLSQIKPDAVISNGGALVRVHEKTIYKCMVPFNTADALIDELINLPGYVELTVEAQSGYYVSYTTPSYGDYTHSVYHNFQQHLHEDVYKITVHLESKTGLKETASHYPDCGMIAFSDDPWYRFANKYATKMRAIQELASYLGLMLEDIIAFGDDYNDEEMLRRCGIGVAMGNAIPEVQAAANVICESNDNDGVAKWLERNLL